MSEFCERVKKTYDAKNKHRKEYDAAIKFLKACKSAIPKSELKESIAEYHKMLEPKKA